MEYNLFVDESCHIQHDKIPVMCIGYTKVPKLAYEELYEKLRTIKLAHKAPEEIKWNKFSKSRMPLYKAVVDFFFDNPMEFRAVLVKYKANFRHEDFNQGSHDNFYYKMTYQLLKPNPIGLEYHVFLDIKDHHGRKKLNKLEEIFNNHHKGESPFVHFQHIRSDDNLFFELTDLFIGAIGYKARYVLGEIQPNETRIEFIKYLESKVGFEIHNKIPLENSKFNVFDHQSR